jgi:hypothetical protein
MPEPFLIFDLILFFLITTLAFIGTAKWRNAMLYNGRYWILTQGRQGQAATFNNGLKGPRMSLSNVYLRKEKTGPE